MQLKDAIEIVSSKFVYRADKFKYLDTWAILKETDGAMTGDCEDYSLTVLWLLCDKSILNFIWNVLILHKYRIYYVKVKNNSGHAVGYANGLYFDNWTNEAFPKEEFIKLTRHSFVCMYVAPFIMMKMFLGFLIK